MISFVAIAAVIYERRTGLRRPLNLCWLTVFVVGVNARILATRIHWPPGSVGRHGLGFLVTIIVCSLAFAFLNFRDTFERLMQDLHDGLAASSLLGGIAVATTIETAFFIIRTVLNSMRFT